MAQVVNAADDQVGHIPRGVAEKLAFLMDHHLISVEGKMVGQNLDGGRHFKLAIDMSIYARPSHRHTLEPELVWATPGQRGFDPMRREDVDQSLSFWD
jgi:SWI/SNF-related matrix-associated actin-dependent regulator of chromatin subfamily A3